MKSINLPIASVVDRFNRKWFGRYWYIGTTRRIIKI